MLSFVPEGLLVLFFLSVCVLSEMYVHGLDDDLNGFEDKPVEPGLLLSHLYFWSPYLVGES